MEFEEVIRNRESIRAYSDKKVPEELLNKILEAGRLAPTAKNNQPQRIFVMSTKKYLDKVDKVTPCRYGAPVVLLVCSNFVESFSNGDYNSFEMDGSIVATHIMLEAANVGVGSTWVRKFEAEEVKEEFELDEELEPVCFINLGYADENYQGSVNHNNRKNLSEIVKFL